MSHPKLALLAALATAVAAAQFPDLGPLRLSFEQRGRYELREGLGFGREPDLFTGLARTRLGITWKAAGWLKLSAMAQDSRAPWYGPNAPASVRDPLDLQEGYVELFGERKTGPGLSAGRRMIGYGESRLIGSPPWGNLGRTWDHARLWYRLPKAQFEVLFASPVKVRIGEFNRPALGDRIWGTYNAFPDFHGQNLLEAYYLRHEQTRLGIHTFGFRLAGPLPAGARYGLESAIQTGKVGAAPHRAGAWFSSLGRQWQVGARTLNLAGEYKFASGSSDSSKSGTFDQMYPANHDKFGHQDLIGWRNIHHLRALATLGLAKGLAANVMYSSFWLASVTDALYNSAGRPVAHSPGGAAGRHVGQEADVFATYRYSHFLIGAGYGYFFNGGFVRRATPGLRPTYLYLTHTVSF